MAFHDYDRRQLAELNRRQWLHRNLGAGFIGPLGLSLPQLLMARHASGAEASTGGSTFGRAKSIIFLWLQGGPPQHETFDPKPDAPVEIRGPFNPISTNVPGIQFCELLPRTARIADKLAIIRSLHTNDNNHDVSGYWVLTGNPYGPGSARQIKPSDWPYFGSIVKRLKPSERLPALSSVWIPDIMRLNENVTPAGQTAGFLGAQWEPERFVGDPAANDYRIDGLQLPAEISAIRADRRLDLLAQINRQLDAQQRAHDLATYNKLRQQAYDLVTSGDARAAFKLDDESPQTRDRYGRHSWGQTVLLGRRLIEAGVRLVHVNWPREPGDNAVNNPMWDTHSKNADRLQDCLCPQFDITFTTLIEDLEQRGLLDETLVVAIGEFGRTPKINREGGRDHWGPVFSCALAGAGISGGQVFGASDKNGAYPAVDPTHPHDLVATLFHLLGIDPAGMFYDRFDRPHPICKGKPMTRLLGDAPATAARCVPGGDVAFVPPYDERKLLDTDFRAEQALIEVASTTRDKGWRATPVVDRSQSDMTVPTGLAAERVGGEKPHVRLGYLNEQTTTGNTGAKRVVLAQEIRNARGGYYTLSIRAVGQAASAADFATFVQQHSFKLSLFRYSTQAKDATQVQELASERFTPVFGVAGKCETYTLASFLGSTVPGANFSIGNGLGVAVIIEALANAACVSAHVRIESVELDFTGKPRDAQVTV